MFSITPYCRSALWGGSRLFEIFGQTGEPNLAEAWLFSLCQEGESRAGGEALSIALEKAGIPPFIRSKLPLVKLIDTNDLLSVQVHPNDEQALRLDGQARGKNEMWYILSARPDAFIYLGLKSSKEAFLSALQKGAPTEELQKIHVQKGDVFFLPAGMVHALGAGITLLEIQQPSDLTYRLWDFMRLDLNGMPRTLHTEKATDVLRSFTKEEIAAIQFWGNSQISTDECLSAKPNLTSIANTPYFKVDILRVDSENPFSIKVGEAPLVLIGLEGNGTVQSKSDSRPISLGKTLCALPSDREISIFGTATLAVISPSL